MLCSISSKKLTLYVLESFVYNYCIDLFLYLKKYCNLFWWVMNNKNDDHHWISKLIEPCIKEEMNNVNS